MLDIKFIRENPEIIKENMKRRGKDPMIVDNLLEIDRQRREYLTEIDELKAERNKIGKKPSESEIVRLKEIKESISRQEGKMAEYDHLYDEMMMNVPNLLMADVPDGKDDSENQVVETVGEVKEFDFPAKDHLILGEELNILDFERGAKVAQSGFYFLKNELALLDLAIQQYAMKKLTAKGFIPIITPDMTKNTICQGTGYNPRGEERQIFNIADEEMSLVGTSEITLGGYYADEILKKEQLPIKLVGLSHCFRVEKGGYGKYSKGLYRVRQFTKVEMFIYCRPEESDQYHQEMLANEKEIWNELGIPYRVVLQCTGDMGSSSMKTYDIEAWMPGRGDYGEVTSTSNTGDYQARRLNIRFKDDDGENKFVHLLNGTAVNNSRFPLTIMENYQQADGSIKVPEVLQTWTGFDTIKKK